MDRLPRPFLQVAFVENASLPDCLRSALNHAKGLHMGIVFAHSDQEYVVQPEMPLDDVLAMADTVLGDSVKAHMEEHRG